jgi:hypothetical protein
MAHTSNMRLFSSMRLEVMMPLRSRVRPAEAIARPLVLRRFAKFVVVHDEFGDCARASSIRT